MKDGKLNGYILGAKNNSLKNVPIRLILGLWRRSLPPYHSSTHCLHAVILDQKIAAHNPAHWPTLLAVSRIN